MPKSKKQDDKQPDDAATELNTPVVPEGNAATPPPKQQPPVEPAEPAPEPTATEEEITPEDVPGTSELPPEVEVVAQQLASLMVASPEIAAKIADALESFMLEKEENPMTLPAGGEPASQAPVTPGATGLPESPGTGAPAPAQVPVTAPGQGFTVDPTTVARLEQLERQMADSHVERELARIGSRYGQLRSSLGLDGILPDKLEENVLLQKVHEVITGKASPFDVALATVLLEQAVSGEGGSLKDRILAAAANTMQKPPAVEGRGGGVAANEAAADVSKMSTTELMNYIKGAVAAKRGMPG